MLSLHNCGDYNSISFGYPLFGFVSIFMGILGDSCYRKRSTFIVLSFIGAVMFMLSILAFETTSRPCDIIVESYIQALALNIVGSALTVLMFIYARTEGLVDLMVIRAIMGTIGNLVPYITAIGIQVSQEQNHLEMISYLRTSLNWITFVSLIFAIMVLNYITGPISLPESRPMTKQQLYKTRKPAIILVTVFFFEFSIASMQFDIPAYFEQFFGHNEALLWGSGAITIQEVLVISVGCLTLFSSLKKQVKDVAVFVSLSSLFQLLFFFPMIGSNPYAGFVIISVCGFYRTVLDIFSYFFFARDVKHDGNHLGFWVAGMNVTLIVGQMLGYNVLRIVASRIHPGLSEQMLLGIAGSIGCVFGISSIWRVYSEEEKITTEITMVARQDVDG